jgi:YVTN family beta-propeller protein
MRLFRVVGAVCVLAATTWAADTPEQALLVLSKGDHTLAIVDPVSLKVVAKAPVGEDPHEVIASADGKLAYVSNYGGGAYNTLAVIDLVNQKALPSIDLGPLRGPHGLTFVGGKVWFTAEGAKVIGRYDPATQKVDWVLGTGQNRTHMIWVSPDMQRIFTTNVSSGTVSVIDQVHATFFQGPPPGAGPGPGGPAPPVPRTRGSRTDWNESVISVGASTEGFDVTPDAKQLWAADAQQGTIAIIDVAAKRVEDTLQANTRGANRLKFTPDGKLVFVSSLGGTGITVLDANTHKEVKRFPMPHGAAGIEMQPNGSRVYVACTGENYVAVIDPHTLEITGHIDAGPQPDGLAWAVQR